MLPAPSKSIPPDTALCATRIVANSKSDFRKHTEAVAFHGRRATKANEAYRNIFSEVKVFCACLHGGRQERYRDELAILAGTYLGLRFRGSSLASLGMSCYAWASHLMSTTRWPPVIWLSTFANAVGRKTFLTLRIWLPIVCPSLFRREAFQSGRIVEHFGRQEFQTYSAMESCVFGLVNNTHAAAPKLFENAVVREGLADERVSAWHLQHILGWGRRQVNERNSTRYLSGLATQLDAMGVMRHSSAFYADLGQDDCLASLAELVGILIPHHSTSRSGKHRR